MNKLSILLAAAGVVSLIGVQRASANDYGDTWEDDYAYEETGWSRHDRGYDRPHPRRAALVAAADDMADASRRFARAMSGAIGYDHVQRPSARVADAAASYHHVLDTRPADRRAVRAAYQRLAATEQRLAHAIGPSPWTTSSYLRDNRHRFVAAFQRTGSLLRDWPAYAPPRPRRVVIERPAPIVIEREVPVIVERRVPVVVERRVPVVVERRVPAPRRTHVRRVADRRR